MNLFQALILGIIQGLTEFIPVSSTAHLLIGQEILGIPASGTTFSFLVLIQWGTLVSLFIYFWEDFLHLTKTFFTKPLASRENHLVWYTIIATIPALIAGYFLKDVLAQLFSTPLLAASIRLFSAAILLSVAEWLGKRTRSLDDMTWIDALIVGVFQIFAIFPGASRSGATISGGMLSGFERKSSARFAFLMSIPVMFAAGIYESVELAKTAKVAEFIPALPFGFITAAFVGWLAIRWLMDYLSKNSLYAFAIYCAALGLVILSLHLFT